jgi:hypothetical protein
LAQAAQAAQVLGSVLLDQIQYSAPLHLLAVGMVVDQVIHLQFTMVEVVVQEVVVGNFMMAALLPVALVTHPL